MTSFCLQTLKQCGTNDKGRKVIELGLKAVRNMVGAVVSVLMQKDKYAIDLVLTYKLCGR